MKPMDGWMEMFVVLFDLHIISPPAGFAPSSMLGFVTANLPFLLRVYFGLYHREGYRRILSTGRRLECSSQIGRHSHICSTDRFRLITDGAFQRLLSSLFYSLFLCLIVYRSLIMKHRFFFVWHSILCPFKRDNDARGQLDSGKNDDDV